MFFVSSVVRFDEILHKDKHTVVHAAPMVIFSPTTPSWDCGLLVVPFAWKVIQVLILAAGPLSKDEAKNCHGSVATCL